MAAPVTLGADPARIDLDVHAGEEVDFTVPVLDDDGAVDPTGWTITARVTTDRGATVLYTFTTTLSAAGVRVTATGTATAAWTSWGTPVARLSVWVTPPAGSPTPLAAGWVRVTR